ncbi:MAG: hypothetical protein QOE33_768 [Acidobacteriota bacterium]|nr:hypothetical protein [Acidobacteriota bacterium]
MQSTHPISEPGTHRTPQRSSLAKRWATLLFIILAVLLALRQHIPPSAAGIDAPASEFSSARARHHVEALAAVPRPIGSPAHVAARDYLVGEFKRLGMYVEVQKTEGVSTKMAANVFGAASVENIIARMKGSAGGRGVLLVAHYDSVPTSRGAGDDASGVAALLETARALNAGAAPLHDVIFLLTDSEETGLLGARAFVKEHPWVNDVGVALNFDARGHGGPVIMFETSSGNQRLIREFAAAAPYPVATSLSYEIYKLLPNETDMTVFKEKGLNGLNFAYIDGVTHYHTMLDTLANLDERSLQHQGTYALSLARHLGGDENTGGEKRDAVYFDLFGRLLFVYSEKWIVPLLLVVALAFGTVTLVALRNGHLTVGGMAAGALAFLLNAALTTGLVWFLWQVVETLRQTSAGKTRADSYHQNIYLLGLVLCGIAATLAFYLLFRKKLRVQNLAFGGVMWWLILAALTSFFVPGASYLFVWPLLFSLITLGLLFSARGWEVAPAKNLATIWLCALPGIFLLVPVVSLIFAALGFGAVVVMALMLALLGGLLVPQLEVILGGRAWPLLATAAAVGVMLLLTGGYISHFDEQHPRQTNVFYALDGDAKKAVWASSETGNGTDEWETRFLSQGSTKGSLAEYVPQRHLIFTSNSAPVQPLAPPEIALLDEALADGTRTLRLRVKSARQAPVLMLQVVGDATVLEAAVDDKRIELGQQARPSADQPNWRLQYYAPPPEGVVVMLKVNSTGPLQLQVIDRSYGLPELSGVSLNQRPAWLIPAPWQLYSDQTLVDKTFTF